MMRRLTDQGVREALLVALTFSAGAIDSISWLVLGKVFSAFMTGNIVFLGFELGGADGPSTWRTIASIGAFGVGAALGTRIVAPTAGTGAVWPRRVTAALAAGAVAQTAFLVVWLAVGGRPSGASADALIAISALAMGLQTAAVFSLGVRAVFSTAATATWTALMGDVATWSQTRDERHRLAAVLVALLAGAVIGAVLVDNAREWAALLPLVIGASVVAVAAHRLHPAPGGREVSATTDDHPIQWGASSSDRATRPAVRQNV
jgi:uncharacterized membrane protein YoaK (UPF0700 family)